MTKTTTGTLTSTLSWNVVDTLQGQGRLVDNGAIGVEFVFANGTGTGQVSELYYDLQTLPSGGSYQYDLTDLTRNAFSAVLESSFNTGVIQSLLVVNNAVDTGAIIYVAATGADAFTGPFAGGSGNLPVHPQSSIQLNNVLVGYPVSAAQKYFQIIDGGYGAEFEVIVIGKTGVI